MAADSEPAHAGQQILHYVLAEKIGQGGMGEVWRATDTTLDRPVAIKLLPPPFAADAERLARFEREARLLASLNHPNIATVYSVHVVEGRRVLAMELVPGEDLSQRIERGPVPVPEALEIGRQIALALEAAHESGVVHRDLKPANVRLTPDGRVKVLDFGLAKALEVEPASPALSQSPTYAATHPASGVLLGTAGYMSPEQARGRPVDRRADIWAFGVVMHELLTGRRAFEGETISDTLAAILRGEPDHDRLPRDLPASVRAMILRCLEKDPRRRLRDIGEALIVLEDAQAGRAGAGEAALAPPEPAATRRGRAWWIAALALATLAGAAAELLLVPRGPAPALRRLTLQLDDQTGEIDHMTISPDGRRIAYVRANRLWVRDLDQLTSRRIADGLSDNLRPAWSPHSDALAFVSDGVLRRVDIASSAITPICTVGDLAAGAGASWTSDGHILFSRGHDDIYRVDEGGGTPEVLIARIDSTEGDLHHPFALPGGAVLFVPHLRIGGPHVLVAWSHGRRKTLMTLPGGLIWQPVYDRRGYILYARVGEGGGIWAAPFSLARLEITGKPRLIAADGTSPTVSDAGLLVYRPGSDTREARIVTLRRSGAVVDTLVGPLAGVWTMSLSPDGHHLALEVRDGNDFNIRLEDLERHTESRFTTGSDRNMLPDWSVDGRQVFYRDDALAEIVERPADGSQAARAIVSGYWPRATPDGRRLIYFRNGEGTGSDIWTIGLDGRDSIPLVRGPGEDVFPMVRPGGGYFLYQSDDTGQLEIYLRPYPTGEGRWQVSTNGGNLPIWSARGDRILYWDGVKSVMEVTVKTTPSLSLGNPHVLFDAASLGIQTWGRYTLLPTPDPDRFIAALQVRESMARPVDAVLVEPWWQDLPGGK